MGQQLPISDRKFAYEAKEVSALRVDLILATDQRDQALAAGRMDIVARQDSEILKIGNRLKELGQSP
jgi:hypothetical protein